MRTKKKMRRRAKKRPADFSVSGLIETMCCEHGGIFLFHEHFRRLVSGCRALGLRPSSLRVVRGAVGVLVRKSPLARSRLRALWWCDDGAMRLSITSMPLVGIPPSGYRMMVERRKKFEPSRLSAFKTTHRTFYEALYSRARRRGFDEALFFNTQDELVEGTRTNVFLVLDGRLATPALSSGCLPGVTRAAVIRMARRLSVPVRETRLSLKDLLRCDEAFVTNAVIGIVPVRNLGGRKMPAAFLGPSRDGCVRCGPVTQRLLIAYRKAVETKAVRV